MTYSEFVLTVILGFAVPASFFVALMDLKLKWILEELRKRK